MIKIVEMETNLKNEPGHQEKIMKYNAYNHGNKVEPFNK